MKHMILQLAQDQPNGAYLFWGFVLFGVAFVIIALELVIPSAGLLALLAGATVVASITSFFMYDTTAGVLSVLTYVVLTPIIVVFGFRLWMNSPLAKYFILTAEVADDSDKDSADTDDDLYEGEAPASMRNHRPQMSALIGLRGRTITPCRPVGLVKIEGRRIEALSELGAIDADVDVVVTDVYDNQVKIRKA
ncbi:MAG: hypothetical protein ACR2GY_06250 [Phycisphaerales bacterium]